MGLQCKQGSRRVPLLLFGAGALEPLVSHIRSAVTRGRTSALASDPNWSQAIEDTNGILGA